MIAYASHGCIFLSNGCYNININTDISSLDSDLLRQLLGDGKNNGHKTVKNLN